MRNCRLMASTCRHPTNATIGSVSPLPTEDMIASLLKAAAAWTEVVRASTAFSSSSIFAPT